MQIIENDIGNLHTYPRYGVTVQLAADAENEDNISEQRRQHGKRVRYGEVIQVCLLAHSEKEVY